MIDLYWVVPLLAYLLVLLGLAGSIIPVLPGPLLIWAGAFVWAWADQFDRIGLPTLLVLAVLTILAWGSDLLLTTISSRRAGVGWRSIAVSILGGVLGAVVLSFIPVVGTLIGAVVGALVALWYMELADKGDRAKAKTAVQSYLIGYGLAVVVEITISLLMVTIFAWQAFL